MESSGLFGHFDRKPGKWSGSNAKGKRGRFAFYLTLTGGNGIIESIRFENRKAIFEAGCARRVQSAQSLTIKSESRPRKRPATALRLQAN